jgi:hypothetical protein
MQLLAAVSLSSGSDAKGKTWKKRVLGILLPPLACFSIVFFAGIRGYSSPVTQDAGHSTSDVPTAYRPTNLKVLPKGISMQDLSKLMVSLQRDLGVQCGFCHEEDPDTKRINYASDENPRKEVTRFMMRMTNDIDEKYLAQLGDRQYATPITCGNCHLGQMHPPPLDPGGSR